MPSIYPSRAPPQTKTPFQSRPDTRDLPLIAIVNGGSIRASLPPGDVTRGDLVRVSPFGNYAVVKRVPWFAVLASIDNGLSTWSDTAPGGRFAQVRGAIAQPGRGSRAWGCW